MKMGYIVRTSLFFVGLFILIFGPDYDSEAPDVIDVVVLIIGAVIFLFSLFLRTILKELRNNNPLNFFYDIGDFFRDMNRKDEQELKRTFKK